MVGTRVLIFFISILFVVYGRQNVSAPEHSLHIAMPHLPAFMQRSDPCACSYRGACSCEGALEFMSCVKEKCGSGDCKCMLDGESHFEKACMNMQSGCPSIGMECELHEATCGGESVGWNQEAEQQEAEQQEKDGEEAEQQEEQISENDEAEERPSDKKGLGEELEGEDTEELPAGWEKAWSEQENRYYYANRKTGESSWTKPAVYNMEPLGDEKPQEEEASEEEQDSDGLPAGWEAVWSTEKERYYYHNSETGESTWVKPEAPTVTTTLPSKYLSKGGRKYVRHDHYQHKVKKLHSHEHHIFAKGIIAIIVVMSLTIALASSDSKVIEKNTWSTMDMVIVTFLALAWFYVIMHFLEFHQLSGWAKVTMHGAISLLLLLVSSIISYVMMKRGGEIGMKIFNGIFNNILLWSFAGFVSTVQQVYKHSALFVLVATIALAVFYVILALFWYFVVGRCIVNREADAASINMLSGAALAAGTVLWVHMVIAGGYHTVEDPRPTKPSLFENIFMSCFSFIYVAVALFVGPKLDRLSDSLKAPPAPSGSQRASLKSYWKKRAVDSLVVFVSFLPYYSCVLSLGHMIIDNLGYDESEIEARLYLAVVSSVIGMCLIVLCAKVGALAANDYLSGILIGLGGFMAGTAWANLLNNSINMMASGYTHPFKLKFAITCFLTSVVFPVYFYYFKPMVEAKMAAK